MWSKLWRTLECLTLGDRQAYGVFPLSVRSTKCQYEHSTYKNISTCSCILSELRTDVLEARREPGGGESKEISSFFKCLHKSWLYILLKNGFNLQYAPFQSKIIFEEKIKAKGRKSSVIIFTTNKTFLRWYDIKVKLPNFPFSFVKKEKNTLKIINTYCSYQGLAST